MKTLLVIGRRIVSALPSIVGVVIVTFLLARALPGDPAAYYAGSSATPESIADIRSRLGLDKPLVFQFVDYVEKIAEGDLGTSLSSGQPVLNDLATRLPASMELTTAALIFALAIGLPLGLLAAVKQGSLADHLCRIIVTVGAAFPTFFVALVLVFIFYYKLDWAPQPLGRLDEIYFSAPDPVTGFYLVDTLIAGDLEAFRGALSQIVLPAISLGLFALAPIARITRASMLAALSSDFCRTARAMGLSKPRILIGYALRNAMLPIVNVLGMVFSFLLGANVLVEQVFAWPGIGAYAVNAVIASDYAAVQGFVLVMAILYVLLNLAVDLVATAIDPRVRYDG
ncbi:Dipeptide transport system permease protein DppB [Hartmannibacter diazotrophicus]|uniref:Dipeptide transport system permease protein DppB n=1 Tax=Hartmannibacter diazotrophicus TaxID=1482074 RepID=A0A2C9D472_9HYPH|nr:ABC transporter permease [Hartmannibacter diazotrophicus]SON55033.1 Dipeptide transport system permease protein DppB [Hartmannibacter diazotrophicus]